jgi:hypothetical protein
MWPPHGIGGEVLYTDAVAIGISNGKESAVKVETLR